MRRYLLDTDVVSDLVRDPRGAVGTRIVEVGVSAIATSVVVAGELRFGAHRAGSPALTERVDALLARLEVLALDDGVAAHYGHVRAHLWRAGTPIGPNDLWIAAHALASDRVLATGNGREFGRVPGLDVVDWRG